MKKKKILLMGNGDARNGGCEAITKGTLAILSECLPDYEVLDCYFDYTDSHQRKENVFPVRYPRRWTLKWLLITLSMRLSERLTAWLLYRHHRQDMEEAAAVLSLGGDNYSTDYGLPYRFIAMGKMAKALNTPFVIWGASIGPFEKGSKFENKIAKHLRDDVSLIVLRESESAEYLKGLGVVDNVVVLSDPAFMMKPEPIKINLPAEYVTINFSDLMAKYVTDGDQEKWVRICADTVNVLVKKLTVPMVFIPHVKADEAFYEHMAPLVESNAKLLNVGTGLNAAQMKWVISRAQINIACRTHSTIASFSMSVPTVCLGYSIKSKGISKQMYGDEKYLVYKKEITTEKVLEVCMKIYENRESVHKSLQKRVGEIRKQSLMAGYNLKNNIER